jgi:hypothetical protein
VYIVYIVRIVRIVCATENQYFQDRRSYFKK